MALSEYFLRTMGIETKKFYSKGAPEFLYKGVLPKMGDKLCRPPLIRNKRKGRNGKGNLYA